jgi:hypothetical protein
MAKLISPFNGHDHEPWQGNNPFHNVEKGYAYVIEEGEDFPEFPHPPKGLVGEMMQFISDAAPHPMQEAAIVGAIGLACGIAGRCYYVNGSGLNEFFINLAPSASGKEAATRGAEKLISAVIPKVKEAATFIGPGDVTSKAALQRYLSKTNPPCFAMFINEIGEWLEPIVSPKASEARQSLRKFTLDLSEKGGKGAVVRKSAYADSANNIDDVYSPAVTIVGDSTPTTFYEIVTEKNTANGFFARFIILQNEGRVSPYNEGHSRVEPSAKLIEELSDLCAHSLNLNHAKTVVDVGFSEGAKAELTDFRNTCTEGRDHTEDDYKRAVWGRGYVHAMRVAAILAVGRHLYKPTIETCDARWAIALVTRSIEKLLNKFEDGEIGDLSQSEVARQTKVRSVIDDWFMKPWAALEKYVPIPEDMRKNGYIPYKYLSKRLTPDATFKHARNGATNAIKNTIAELIRNGELVRASPAETKHHTKSLAEFYRLAGGASLINPQMTEP